MSHSTHVGFSAPDCSDTTIDKFSCFPIAARRWIAGLPMCPRSRLSDDCGVSQMLRPTTVSKLGKRPGAHADSGVIVAAIALHVRGVGQRRTIPGKPKLDGPLRTVPFFVTCGSFAELVMLSSIGSLLLGVGHKPDALSAMGSAQG